MKRRVTVACSESILADAAHIAAVMMGEGQEVTFGTIGYQDAAGNRYSVASHEGSLEWIESAASPPERPDWDAGNSINMAGAGRAYAALTIWAGEGEPPAAEPGRMTAIVGPNGPDALALMGLSRLSGLDP